MRIKRVLALVLISSSLFNVGCKKDDHDDDHDHHQHGEAKPVLTFLSPTEGQQFNESDTIWLRVNIKSEEELHDYKLQVKNITANEIVYTYNGHSHNTSVTTALPYIANITSDANMQLTVTNYDHDGGLQQTSNVNFKVINNVTVQKPVITIQSPSASAHFSDGSVMNIKGSVTHTANLKSFNITVKRDGVNVFDVTPNVTGLQSYNFDTAYTINTAGHGHADFDLIISATDVHDVTETKTQSYHIH